MWRSFDAAGTRYLAPAARLALHGVRIRTEAVVRTAVVAADLSPRAANVREADFAEIATGAMAVLDGEGAADAVLGIDAAAELVATDPTTHSVGEQAIGTAHLALLVAVRPEACFGEGVATRPVAAGFVG
jgi:hypothetical protein